MTKAVVSLLLMTFALLAEVLAKAQQPKKGRKFEVVINFNTAKQIGLEITQWTLMKADRVIR